MVSNPPLSRCPTCGRIYSDPTQTFCLDDGSRLVGTSRESLQPTMVAPPPPPPETVIYQPQANQAASIAAPTVMPRIDSPWAPPTTNSIGNSTATCALIISIVSLLGPLFGLIGAIMGFSLRFRVISRDAEGAAVLIALVGLIIGLIFGIIGQKWGRKALRRIRDSATQLSGKGTARTAVTLGILSIVLSPLLFIMLSFTINFRAAIYQLT